MNTGTLILNHLLSNFAVERKEKLLLGAQKSKVVLALGAAQRPQTFAPFEPTENCYKPCKIT